MSPIWAWLQGDLASWLAVVLAVMAIIYALRNRQHTELELVHLRFDNNGGPIDLELNLTTYSHAARIDATAKLEIDGVRYPLKWEPMKTPMNYQFATVNTIQIRFTGQYEKRNILPKYARINAKAKLSDGSQASFKKKLAVPKDEVIAHED